MAANKKARDAATMAFHRAEIARGHLLGGETVREMSQRLGIAPTTVHEDLKWLRHRWVQEALSTIDEVKGEQLNRIRSVEAYAHDAWLRSTGERTTITTRKTFAVVDGEIQSRRKAKVRPAGDGTSDGARAEKLERALKKLVGEERKEVSKEEVGDPRYLELILKCVDMRLRIFGIYDRSRASALGLSPALDGMVGQDGETSIMGADGLPTFRVLANRLTAGMQSMLPHERTAAFERMFSVLREADALNQELLGLPPARTDLPGMQDAVLPSVRTGSKVPPNVRVVDGEVRYIDEDEEE